MDDRNDGVLAALGGELLFQAHPAASLVMSFDGTIILANGAATRLLGWSSQELCQLNRIPLSDRRDVRRINAVGGSCTPHAPCITKMSRKDGVVLRVEVVATSFEDRRGELRLLLTVRSLGPCLLERSVAAPGSQSLLGRLTPAELRVLHLLPTNMTLGRIAETLSVSRNTVKTQTISIYRKFGVHSRDALVDRALALELVAAPQRASLELVS